MKRRFRTAALSFFSEFTNLENRSWNGCRHGPVNSLVNCQVKDHVKGFLRKYHSRNMLAKCREKCARKKCVWNFLALCFSLKAKPNISVTTAPDSGLVGLIGYHISTYSVSYCLEIYNVGIMTSVQSTVNSTFLVR